MTRANRREFLALSFAVAGGGALALAGCGGGKSSFVSGGGGALLQGKAAVRAIALSAHQSISGGRFYAFAAIKLAAPSGSQFTTRAAHESRAVPDTIVYDDGLQLYKKYASTGGTVSVRYYTDAAATIPAGTATLVEVGIGDFTNNYPSYPATVNFNADTTEGTVPFSGSGSITYLDASGANTLTGSFTSRRNNVTLAGTLNLTGAGAVTGGMTMTQGGVTTRVTNITGTLSSELVGDVVSEPYGWTGTVRFSVVTGAFTLTLNTGTGTNGGTASASLDASGNLVIEFADGTTQTILNPLNEFIDGSSGGGGTTPTPTPTPTPSPTPSSNPGDTKYTAILLHPAGFDNSYAAGVSENTQAGVSVNTQVGGGYNSAGGSEHALLWSGTAASAIDLHPAGFGSSYANGVYGNNQVGYGNTQVGRVSHALLWSGTAASAIDLNPPAGFTNSSATGVYGNTQVGQGGVAGGLNHALLWSGTAASVVDLHPAGFDNSRATGVSGNNQVGSGRSTATGRSHALLWSGTAASAIDLHPAGFTDSNATGVSGNSQVGYGIYSAGQGGNHALLWSGSAASAVDLHPAGVTDSFALAVSGNTQVGYVLAGIIGQHAVLWNGTAASYIDLHQYLSSLPVNIVTSLAKSIDPTTGNIVGHGADSNGVTYALLWKRNN